MSANVSLSLDEIISKQKKSKGGREVGGFRSDGVSRSGSGGKPRTSVGGRGFHSSRVPDGKWKHDLYDKKPASRERGEQRGGARLPSGGNPNKKVRIHLSSLSPAVTSADLEELFEDFNFDTCVVHFNETGESLCTGEVALRRSDGLKLIEKFKGVAIDNIRMVMRLIDDAAVVTAGTISDRVQIPQRRVMSGGRVRKQERGERRPRTSYHDLDRVEHSPPPRARNGRGRGGKDGRSGPSARRGQVKMTQEELDEQLDAYMTTDRKGRDVDME